ncbi:MAG: hypothetical protein KDA28_15915 [Phycisphaerales bacterium]|nr:hypothetical protein [Phycisphaerales bacterium]
MIADIKKRWRVSSLEQDLAHPGEKYRAIVALGEIDHPHAEVAILAALMGADDDPAMLALAAQAAGKRRIEAARPKLEALLGWTPPRAPADPDHTPESWQEDRLDAMRDDANEERVQRAAREALDLLG